MKASGHNNTNRELVNARARADVLLVSTNLSGHGQVDKSSAQHSVKEQTSKDNMYH